MPTYHLKLQSDASKTYRCTRAANSLDIDVEKKLTHEFKVDADFSKPYNVGLIVGASGSGKTTLARHVFGDDCFKTFLDLEKPIIDQLPPGMSYDECASALNGIGLSQVPCWIRPAATLSNGQRARAEAVLALHSESEHVVLDEWTSVVDRTVAKAMSYSLQKYARRTNKRLTLLSCHYDVIEWLEPDWILDCNAQTFTEIPRGSLRRQEKLHFDIREIRGQSWRRFSKYHYLSDRLPGGRLYFFGLFHGEEQIGFQCFANYIPQQPKTYHSNRTVIHPDFVGFGLGMKLINESSKIMHERGYRIMAKFSSTPVYRSMIKSPLWRLRNESFVVGNSIKKRSTLSRKNSIRTNLKIYSFEYVGETK